MHTIRTFTVVPSLPPALEPLKKLAYNLWWCWNHEAILLFHRLDRELWEATDHNPVRVLGAIRQARLEERASNDAFLSHMERVVEQFEEYLDPRAPTWFSRTYPEANVSIAYFSAEYGLTEGLPVYSGGLGILAGDHVKSASDLGIPLVGVGLLYRVGYFRQYLNLDGWQQERYPENDFYNLPVSPVTRGGKPVTVAVTILDRRVEAQIWRVDVGRVQIYLLDTNLEQNHPDDRTITAQLYGGDLEMRIRQEILLGVGGQRALQTLGIDPTVCHMNEGHSAFQALERIRTFMKSRGMDFHEARVAAQAGNVFTTHTPVPAGNDMFPPNLMEKYLSRTWQQLGLSREEFLGLGRINPGDPHEPFCMTVLALRLAAYSNGVSQLHGDVSRQMWQGIWPELPVDEVPIGAITNGIHVPSWISRDMAALFDRYVGLNWRQLGLPTLPRSGAVNGLASKISPAGGAEEERNGAEADLGMDSVWRRVNSIPDEELWRTHERLRARLVAFARHQLRKQLQSRGAPQSEVEEATEVLDPDALTIGFARRFATYKRATLLFRDLDRLKKILGNKKKPVQIIIAGKAHPRDNAGKELIRQIIHHARDPVLRKRVVFIEDYSMFIGRRLVQGVDLWLNTPRRPMEASGTSGMKCPPNGGLNMSTPDGWWPEGAAPDNGWTIGQGEEYVDNTHMDEVESRALYDLLEKEVVPAFYDRTETDLPRGWISRMKASIRSVCPQFNTDRMVSEYTELFYMPAVERTMALSVDDFSRARSLAGWQRRLEQRWSGLAIEAVDAPTGPEMEVGGALRVQVTLRSGEITPEELTVQLYHGELDSRGKLRRGETVTMEHCEALGSGRYRYSGSIPCRTSGRHGFAVRVLPKHRDLVTTYLPNLIRWG